MRRRIPSSSSEEEWSERESSPNIFNPFANQDAAEQNLLNADLSPSSETSSPIFLISAHGLLRREKERVPDGSLYIYDAHCGASSEGNNIERAFFKQRLPPNSDYLSYWHFDKNSTKIGGDDILKVFPQEEYYDSMLGYLLDYRHIDSKQTYDDEEIDDCDNISIQKSGIYLYEDIAERANKGVIYNAKTRTYLKYVYYNSDGELTELKRGKSSGYKNARKALLQNEPDASPFYIITREDVVNVYQDSIYPTVEDLLLYFDEDSDFMYFRDFVPIVENWDSTVSDCFKRYNTESVGCIIISPSCRSNQNISEKTFMKMRNSSDEVVSKRYKEPSVGAWTNLFLEKGGTRRKRKGGSKKDATKKGRK